MNTIVPLRPSGRAHEFHPFAAIWPLLDGEDFEKFAADIKSNGLHLPIVLYQGKILDGRNRYRACIAADVEPHFEDAKAANDDEALELVVSLNDQRRHMSVARRSFAAARLANMKEGRPKQALPIGGVSDERDPSLGGHKISVLDAAAALRVSPGSVARARTVLSHAPELEKEVVAKKMALHVAADKVRPKRPTKLVKPGKPRKPAKKTLMQLLTERRQAATAKSLQLTPEQVDPEFQGTPMEFTTKYGHVQVETAEQRATSRFTDWAIDIGHVARALSQKHFPEVDINWLRNPRPADIDRLRDALEVIRPKIDEAVRLLGAAEKMLK